MHKRFARLIALALALLLAGLAPAALAEPVITNATADCFDYYPATLTFAADSVTVEGYFFNFNLGRSISDLLDLEISVYDSNDVLICSALFTELSDTLRSMALTPGLSSLQSFTFTDMEPKPG